MKYKIIGAVVCFAAILLSVIVPLFESEDKGRYHQHLEALPKESCSHSEEVFCSHLPLISIETGGKPIPGDIVPDERGYAIKDENNNLVTTLSETGEKTIRAKISAFDSETKNNHFSDEPAISTEADIRIRGNSSRLFDKKNYYIRLVSEEGLNNPQKLLGMDSHHEWALHGPFLDKSLIRNYLFYNLSGEIMDYSPNVRFCEVMIDGEYMGLYLLTETITSGGEEGRLNISVSAKDNTFSGYIIRLDRGSSNPIANIETFSSYSGAADIKMNIEYPGTKNLTEEMAKTIIREVSAFEKALYSYDYDTKDYGYKNFIDTEDFVDYFLINELTCNYDVGAYSTYYYKGLDGLYHLCVWDFNNSCDNYQETKFEPRGFSLNEGIWYYMLFKDEDFVEDCIKRYYELRNDILDPEFLEKYIDETVEYLGPAIDRNFEKWGYSFVDDELLYPEYRNLSSHEEAVSQLKTFLNERIAWFDDNIEILRQYSADSAVKKYNENNK